MSDYTQQIDFSAKDALLTGDANKVAKGADIDTEMALISTAIATKLDSSTSSISGYSSIATQAQAEAGTDNTVIITPLRAEQHMAAWAAENDAMIADIHALDLSADAILGWDQSAGAAIGFTLTDELEFNLTTIRPKSTMGGDGISASSGILSLTAQSVSATVPISIASGVLGWDSSSITNLVGSGVSQSADGYLLDDAGVLKVVPYDAMAILTGTQDAAQTFALTDVNTIQTLTGSTNRIWTIPKNTTVAIEVGAVIICHNSGTGDLTLTAATDVIIDSVFHTAGSTAQSDRVVDGGTAVLIKIATDTWALSGDLADS